MKMKTMELWRSVRAAALAITVGAVVLTAGTLPAWAEGEFLQPWEIVAKGRYPSGVAYDLFTLTMPGLGLLFESGDQPFPNNLRDDRCDANGEAAGHIALSTALAVSVPLQAACDVAPEGPVKSCRSTERKRWHRNAYHHPPQTQPRRRGDETGA